MQYENDRAARPRHPLATRSLLRKLASAVYRSTVRRQSPLTSFGLPAEEARLITPQSEVADLFYSHEGRPIHKWTHYLSQYDRYFSRFRSTPVRMLEIGVDKGGSLELWRRYLGPQATICGIDIDPLCAARVDAPNRVRIGSQNDPSFLRDVVDEMGGVDLVLDDGSHRGPHIIASFRTLFPLLTDGGIYAIEDMHDDYSEWPGTRANQSLSFVKSLIDDMHGHYTGLPPLESTQVAGIHVFDSIAFIEKQVERRTAVTVVPA